MGLGRETDKRSYKGREAAEKTLEKQEDRDYFESLPTSYLVSRDSSGKCHLMVLWLCEQTCDRVNSPLRVTKGKG